MEQQQTYQIIHSYNILHRLQEHHLTQTVIIHKYQHYIYTHMVSFSSLALIFSFVSMANLRYLLATTFSSLSFLSNSFHHSRVARCFSGGFLLLTTFSFPLVFFGFLSCSIFFASYPQPFFPLLFSL